MRRRSGPTFTAIDFETANRYADSACAVALVRVERGRIAERFCSLIRPWTRWFEFTDVHGITPEDVEDAPRFKALWPKLAPFFRGVDFVAAHNASFDARVLSACCEEANVSEPSLPFECTVEIARRTWGIYPTRLPDVARYLRIPLKHHDPASDAFACAKIVTLSRE